MQLTIRDDYGTHHYDREWEQTEDFCPSCGAKGIWAEQGNGDYYVGADYLCIHCGACGTMQWNDSDSHKDKIVSSRVNQIRKLL